MPICKRGRMTSWQANETSTVRLGKRDYAVDHDWAGLDQAGVAGPISEIAWSGEHLWVLQRADPPLLVFDRDGRQMAAHATGAIQDGHGLAPDGAGGVLAVDRDAHQVLRLAADGALAAQWGTRHRPRWAEPFNHPTSAAFAPDGSLWVADGYGNARVHRFAADGSLALSFGELGEGPGQFRCPHAVAVAADGRVVVADRDNDRVQVFTATGEVLAIWGGFARPMAVAIGPDGWVYVTDQVPSLHRIALDGTSRSRARPARNLPHGLAIAGDGTIYLAEMNPRSLVRMRPI